MKPDLIERMNSVCNHRPSPGGSLKSWLLIGGLLIAGLLMAGCGASSTQLSAGSQDPHKNHSSNQASPQTAPTTQSDASGQDPHKNHSSNQANPQTVPTPRIPAFFASAEAAKPLPEVLDPKQFSTPAVVKAYQYAKENPELFAQQPCYCLCDASYQHRSLLDCYASDHSVGCQLCLKEGHFINQLHKEGKSAAEIREQIIRGEWRNVKLD